MKRILFALTLILAGSTASAVGESTALNQRIGAMSYTYDELVAAGAGVKPRTGGGGAVIRKVLPKAGKVILYGGNMLTIASFAYDALNWLYNEAKQSSGDPTLDQWWQGVSKPADYWSGTGQGLQQIEYVCTSVSYGTTFHKHHAKTNDGRYAVYTTITTADGNRIESADTQGTITCSAPVDKTLDQFLRDNPNSSAALSEVLRKYINANPAEAREKIRLEPPPNENQEHDDIRDPGLDTDQDGQTDGDEARVGRETQSGNRPHEKDGPLSDPNEPDSKSTDLDEDDVPDWRDGDDDNDQWKDDEERSDWQKDKEKNPDSERDLDNDGVPDRIDDDDDNDQWTDEEEERYDSDPKDSGSKPADNDRDGTPDKDDKDDDNDGWTDKEELDDGSNPEDSGSEPTDTDKDGTPDKKDDDDDNDGWTDKEESDNESDPSDPEDKPRDTDSDGRPDGEDPDNDNDGWTDRQEEEYETNPDDPNEGPPDNDGDKKPDDKDPDDDNDGSPDTEEEEKDTDPKDPEDKPVECGPGSKAGADNKCEPEEEDPKCPPGSTMGADSKCEEEPDGPKSPVPDECGVISIPRFLAHTGNVLRDIVFPCEEPASLFEPVLDVLKTKFPFSIIDALNKGVVTDVRGGSGSNPVSIPRDWGYFQVDLTSFSSIWVISKLLFKTALGIAFFSFLIGRLIGQVTIS